ncbi:MAG TPA: hypothetical protein VN870_06900, partial [Streptosporangiaceae bacterium]|nr:hypothetical protein [Streptosporangiaceae bacterium]
QARVAGENPSSASAVPLSGDSSAMLPYCLAPPTFPAVGRVGFHHKTLASFLGAIASSGLRIRDVREFSGGGVVLPCHIGLVAEN